MKDLHAKITRQIYVKTSSADAVLQVGVYMGCCGSEIHAQWLANVNKITGYEQTGCTLSMFANRLSFNYDFRGPSKAVDTGTPASCVSSLKDHMVCTTLACQTDSSTVMSRLCERTSNQPAPLHD